MIKRLVRWLCEVQLIEYSMYWIVILSVLFGIIAAGCTISDWVGGVKKSPDRITLAPGQSAVTLETTTVLARIPAQGNVLYEGPVAIERDTVVIKPIKE